MRLIDADALDKDLRKYAERKAAGGHIEIASGVLSAAERIRQCAPTVDSVPAAHGHWEVAIGYDINRKVMCSECNRMNFEPSDFCPNCGSRMDEIE